MKQNEFKPFTFPICGVCGRQPGLADDNKRGGEATQSRDERREETSAARQRDGHWHQACCEGPTPCLATAEKIIIM